MTKDKGCHKKIREDIQERLNNLENTVEIHCSHGGDGDIYFFKKTANEKKINFARPDILLIRKDNHTLIIEIELSDSPKHLMGVACAIYSSEKCSHKRLPIKIEKKSLLLVLNSENVCKRGSEKDDQIKDIKSFIRTTLNFEDFNIVTEKNAFNAIKDWLNHKKMQGDICVSPPN